MSNTVVPKENLHPSHADTGEGGEMHIRCRKLDDGSFATFCGKIFPANHPTRTGRAGTGDYCFVCEDTYRCSSRAEQDYCWEILGQRNPNP